MQRTAECAVVGGGIVGLSIAYHLAARGVTDVVVLERESMVGTGSTGRCAGGFRHQFSTRANVLLSQLSIGKLVRFEEEMEQLLDFHQDGYLFLLTRESDVEAFRRNVELQRSLGVEVELFEPGRVADVLPGTELRLDDVLAATYCGGDGVSDPAGVTEGYRRNAVRLGARVATGCEVVGIERRGGGVAGVRLATGETVSAPLVVNAAGPHAAAVGKMAGVEVPVVPLRRCIWTTRPFEGAPARWTLVIDFASGFYFHREGGGVLFGMGNREEPPTFDVEVDWEFFETVAAVGSSRFPALGDAAIQRGWAGSYETSPDANPILGRVPGVEGLILANGFSGHGFQHAPGVGQLIAEEIVDGRATTLDIAPFSITRFEGGATEGEYGVV
jgi:sarcosine oxidase subunit beta